VSDSYVDHWLDEPPEHPVTEELRGRPGQWAILKRDRADFLVVYRACQRHPNVEVTGVLNADFHNEPVRARWLPDPVVAAIQVLKGGGYGG
jgi:hypothetical protein